MTCLVCGGTAVERSLFGGHRFLGTKYYRMRCTTCGFIFVNPIPDASAFEKMYDDSYFADYYGGGDDVGYESSVETGMARADAILSDVAAYKPSGRVLDIGCAGGHFLAEAKKRGYECLGVELNTEQAEHARKAFGLEVIDGAFDAVQLEAAGRRFDVIYMGDSLEHLPDPKGTLARVRRLLAPDGVYVLNGPMTLNTSVFTAVLRLKLLLGKGRSEWYVDDPPHHLWEWNARTQRRFIADNGFEILHFATREMPGRPLKMLTRALHRPLTTAEVVSERLKSVSAWCTNALMKHAGWGDRVLVIARKSATP